MQNSAFTAFIQRIFFSFLICGFPASPYLLSVWHFNQATSGRIITIVAGKKDPFTPLGVNSVFKTINTETMGIREDWTKLHAFQLRKWHGHWELVDDCINCCGYPRDKGMIMFPRPIMFIWKFSVETRWGFSFSRKLFFSEIVFLLVRSVAFLLKFQLFIKAHTNHVTWKNFGERKNCPGWRTGWQIIK